MTCDEHGLIADVALFAGGKVLLVKYADSNRYDHQKGWFLPDAGIGSFEHPERAARRILEEQLGVAIPNVRLGNIESFKGNDGTWHLPFHYYAELDSVPKLKPSPDVEAAEWFDLERLPPKADVAHHGWALTTIAQIRRPQVP